MITSAFSTEEIEHLTDFYIETNNKRKEQVNGASVPTVDNLIILAAVFGCKVDDLIVVDVIGNDLNAKIA